MAEFHAAESSNQCGMRGEDYCSGAPTEVCGGRDAISIYSRLPGSGPAPTPTTSKPVTPKPVTPTPVSPHSPGCGSYEPMGCFGDDKHNRVFGRGPERVHTGGMTSQVRCTDAYRLPMRVQLHVRQSWLYKPPKPLRLITLNTADTIQSHAAKRRMMYAL